MARRVIAAAAMLLLVVPACQRHEMPTKFKAIPTQFIAALADPSAKSGTGAELWGRWQLDPGPRGVGIGRYEQLKANGGVAPARWKFDDADWWLEEHGLIMEKPEFPLAPGKYVVTGDREVITVLTIHPKGADGKQRWELADGATFHDVTHLACRSARYTPEGDPAACTPAKVSKSEFPVAPGAVMPAVDGCHKQDYSVLFLVGVAAGNG